MIGELLHRVTTALDTHGIPYMLTGSLASSMYGIPRATNDIDIVILPRREQLISLVQLFQRVGLTVAPEGALAALRNKTQFNVIDFARGLKVDLIVRKDRDFSVTEFDRRETHEVEGMRLTIAQPKDVLLAKLEWSKISESERRVHEPGCAVTRSRSFTVKTGHTAKPRDRETAPTYPPIVTVIVESAGAR